MSQPKWCFICPTYGAFDYAKLAIQSFLRSIPTGTVIVADDASPDWAEHMAELAPLGENRVAMVRWDTWGGLTRSWNAGLRIAKSQGAEYTICGNSDLLFPLGWEKAIEKALAHEEWSLVGPVSNAPGVSNKVADVSMYDLEYRHAQQVGLESLPRFDEVSSRLQERYLELVVEAPINGFCMVAKTATWWSGAFSQTDVFNPVNAVNSKGRMNPTPLMTLNEDALQHRWHAMGRHTGVCPGSFVFHYRAATRGDRHKVGQWARLPNNPSPCR